MELTEAELENFQNVCRKIINAYKFRLQALKKRHFLLKEIDYDFQNVSSVRRKFQPPRGQERVLSFYDILETLLKREQRVLDIILRKELPKL